MNEQEDFVKKILELSEKAGYIEEKGINSDVLLALLEFSLKYKVSEESLIKKLIKLKSLLNKQRKHKEDKNG